jgi:hypothetical protein
MSHNLSIGVPFTKSFTTTQYPLTTSPSLILAFPTNPSTKRVFVLVQNTSATETIQITGNNTDTVGVILPPLSPFSVDNYNGSLYAFANSGTPAVNVTVASV